MTSQTPPDHLVVARVLGAHGVRGELRCQILTEFPERFKRTRRVFLGPPVTPFDVLEARVRGGVALLRLDGIDTPEAAAALKGREVLVAREDAVPLPEGRYYWHEVLGLEVQDEAGSAFGPVVDIIETGANDVYVVRTPAGDLLLPAIRDVVLLIDPRAGHMTVRLMPGLEPAGGKRASR